MQKFTYKASNAMDLSLYFLIVLLLLVTSCQGRAYNWERDSQRSKLEPKTLEKSLTWNFSKMNSNTYLETLSNCFKMPKKWMVSMGQSKFTGPNSLGRNRFASFNLKLMAKYLYFLILIKLLDILLPILKLSSNCYDKN